MSTEEAKQKAREKYDLKHPIVPVRLPSEIVRRLDRVSRDTSRSEKIREAVEEWLDKKENPENT